MRLLVAGDNPGKVSSVGVEPVIGVLAGGWDSSKRSVQVVWQTTMRDLDFNKGLPDSLPTGTSECWNRVERTYGISEEFLHQRP